MDRIFSIFITVVYIYGKNTIRLSFTMELSASPTVIFEGFRGSALNERVRPKVIVPGRMHSSARVGETDLAIFITHLRFNVQSVTNSGMNWRNSCFRLRGGWSCDGVAQKHKQWSVQQKAVWQMTKNVEYNGFK